jgi:hypothetical protein
MRTLTGLALAAALMPVAGCVEVFRGAVVQLNLAGLAPSVPGEHLGLYAALPGGVAPVVRLKVLRRVADCGADARVTPERLIVQRYDDGLDLVALCDTDRNLGNLDQLDLATASLVGGIRVDTAVDLRDAEALLLTRQVDGEADPRPGPLVARAALAAGVSPRWTAKVACAEAFCAAIDPADPLFAGNCGENLPVVPRARRGVLAGIFVRAPEPDDPCAAVELGRAAVVPAEDDAWL